MKESLSTIVYFCPWITGNCQILKDEIESIANVITTLKEKADIVLNLSPSWAALIDALQDPNENDLLIVFRLDFIEKEHMMLSEVLPMLTSLIKFVGGKKTVNIAVVVPKCSPTVYAELKRNDVLGIIPGLRFFDIEHSIEAYEKLRRGYSHWPAIAMTPKLKRVSVKVKTIELTKRQYEIFTLIARRGLSNGKIAQLLHISENTVKIHVSAILKRYGVQNRTQLVLANDTGTVN